MLKGILITIYVLISAVLFFNFRVDPSVWGAFMVNNLILFGIMLFHLYAEKEYSPFISVFLVFNFLFFIVAPIIQLNVIFSKNETFMTGFVYDVAITLKTCGFIALFNSVFFIGYLYLKKVAFLREKPRDLSHKGNTVFGVVMILVLSCLLIFVGSWSFIQEEISRPSWLVSSSSVMSLLIWKKVLFLVPYAGIILSVQYLRRHKKKLDATVIIIFALLIFTILLLWFKNPLTEKRNALGPIYIGLIFLFTPGVLKSNIRTLAFMFFSMVVVFPLSAIITHTPSTLSQLRKKPSLLLDEFEGEGIGNVFSTMHYDAFANIGATIDFVANEGWAHGNQLLGAFFFFVPRAIWEDKPVSTGEVIGNHLVDDYGLNYTNLSNPMVSEGYINFGIAGVVLMALLLAISVIYLKSWLQSDNYLKRIMSFYFAIHLLFLLRGDFVNGYSYYIGTLAGVILIPKFIEMLLKHFYKTQRKWKEQKV